MEALLVVVKVRSLASLATFCMNFCLIRSLNTQPHNFCSSSHTPQKKTLRIAIKTREILVTIVMTAMDPPRRGGRVWWQIIMVWIPMKKGKRRLCHRHHRRLRLFPYKIQRTNKIDHPTDLILLIHHYHW